MGSPNTGEIYEGGLRDPDDVPLNADQVEWLKALPVRDRIAELKEMQAKLRESNVDMVSGDGIQRPNPPATRPLPRYKCHKEVWALKIKAIETVWPTVEELQRILDSNSESPAFDAAMITPEDERYAPFGVGDGYMRKHDPKVGGYYVVYDDGYQSYSPAKAFEEGYTKL